MTLLESSCLKIETKNIAVEPDFMHVSVDIQCMQPMHIHFPHVYHLVCVWTSSHIQYPACNQRL